MNREQFDDYIKQEFSEGTPIEPVPEPPPPIQYPPVPKSGIWDVPIPLSHIPGLCIGILLIGIAIGMALNEWEFVRKDDD